jgi:hypothetical protein
MAYRDRLRPVFPGYSEKEAIAQFSSRKAQ